jgi:multidrug resistance efflux pump
MAMLARARMQSMDRRPASGAARPRRAAVSAGLALLVLLLAALLGLGYRAAARQSLSTSRALLDTERIEVGATIGGRLSRLYSDEGDVIRKGQILALLDPTELLSQRSRAERGLALARQSQTQASRNRSRARLAWQRAGSDYRAGRLQPGQLAQVRQRYEASASRLEASTARLALARAGLAQIQSRLAQTQIVAPRDGIIGRRWSSVGAVVSAAQPLFTLFDPSGLWVTIYLEERRLSAVRLNDSLQIRLPAYPRERFTGRLIRLGSTCAGWASPPGGGCGGPAGLSRDCRLIPLRASLRREDPAGPPPRLLPGMSARVKILLAAG